MNKEHEIAKANILSLNKIKEAPTMGIDKFQFIVSMKTHKKSCQRFLEFLEEEMKRGETINKLSETYISTGELEEKITDLKNTIQEYDKNDITQT